MEALVFKKLENGNYAAPSSHEELTLNVIVDAIKDYNDMDNGKSLYFGENGNVYLTDTPIIHLSGYRE